MVLICHWHCSVSYFPASAYGAQVTQPGTIVVQQLPQQRPPDNLILSVIACVFCNGFCLGALYDWKTMRIVRPRRCILSECAESDWQTTAPANDVQTLIEMGRTFLFAHLLMSVYGQDLSWWLFAHYHQVWPLWFALINPSKMRTLATWMKRDVKVNLFSHNQKSKSSLLWCVEYNSTTDTTACKRKTIKMAWKMCSVCLFSCLPQLFIWKRQPIILFEKGVDANMKTDCEKKAIILYLSLYNVVCIGCF